ncbi:hypothetical protein D5R55_01195 [Burkholderia cenocepacia]|uniref:Uncharacterized protein n=1 Tax=Burkholderia cenocepacia TaxID=95486 RepID=A0A3Q9F077_9BURK|nr:hypothetical protein D5R55_01195 [Burkholderia cenocepacia]
MALAQILHRLVPALGLPQNPDDLLVGKSFLHRVLLASRIKENSLAIWLQETSQVSHRRGQSCYQSRCTRTRYDGRATRRAGRRSSPSDAPR